MTERTTHTTPALFPLGDVLLTPGAAEALLASCIYPFELIERHVSGDWGTIDPEDQGINEQALVSGARIMSVYELLTGVRIWVITEANRSCTTLLLPSEY